MKAEETVSATSVHVSDRSDPAYTDAAGRARAEKLLRSYPDVSDRETTEIIHFLKKGRLLEIGLVSGSDEFRQKVAAFRKEHARHFRLTAIEMLSFFSITMLPVGVVAWHSLMQ